ncbi:MAG: hypothetical protein PHW12_05280 [Smithella sp.]|nr:hypothetical protein [Smithella sp.]
MPKPLKKPRYTDIRVAAFINAYCDILLKKHEKAGVIKEACKISGVGEYTAEHWLSRPAIKEMISKRLLEIQEKSGVNSPEYLLVMMSLLKDLIAHLKYDNITVDDIEKIAKLVGEALDLINKATTNLSQNQFNLMQRKNTFVGPTIYKLPDNGMSSIVSPIEPEE